MTSMLLGSDLIEPGQLKETTPKIALQSMLHYTPLHSIFYKMHTSMTRSYLLLYKNKLQWVTFVCLDFPLGKSPFKTIYFIKINTCYTPSFMKINTWYLTQDETFVASKILSYTIPSFK